MDRKKITIPALHAKKQRGEPITMITAYDYPGALAVDEAGVDLILVGDSLGMVVLGYDSTVPVTMDEMIIHTAAVKRGTKYRAHRRRYAVPVVSSRCERSHSQRRTLPQRRRRGFGETRRRRGDGPDRESHRRRGHRRDGPHRPDAAIRVEVGRLSGAGQNGERARSNCSKMRWRCKTPARTPSCWKPRPIA